MASEAIGLTNVSAASFRGPEAAPGSIVAAFGENLATATQAADSTILPESLAGTTVTVKDSAGVERAAGLFFVSPGQVNYLVPEGSATGAAVVTITNGQGAARQGPLLIRNAAPGLFSANADGKGVAAANALRFDPSNVQTLCAVFTFDQEQDRFMSVPIDMGFSSDRVYLVLYGTGIRHAAVVSVTVGDQEAPVSWAGPQSEYAGLDQVNVELPRSVEGQGVVSVVLTADDVEANPLVVQVPQHEYLNLDFETVRQGRPSWLEYTGSGYQFAADSSVAVSGAQSLRIRNLTAVEPTSAYAMRHFPIEAARGKHLRLTGFIKTEGINRGYAGIYVSVYFPSGAFQFDNMRDRAPRGTTDWSQYQIDVDVSADAARIDFGAYHYGDGTAWFDNLSFEIDGVPYLDGPAPYVGEPKAELLDWVRQTAKPFLTPVAGNGFEDLAFVKAMVGDARIVGLGEGTHGTREFFQMKHRLLEYLATEMGFTIFAMEAGMPEAHRLNEYVLYGVGNPRELLKVMYYWPWNTQEVLDMILWMREFNASGKGRLQFTGFDMQAQTVAAANVTNFVTQADPSYLPTVASAFAFATTVLSRYRLGVSSAAEVQSAVDGVHAVWQYLTDHRAEYLTTHSAWAVDWAIQNTRIMEQATYYAVGGPRYRDQCMAANIDWILQQNPGEKIVLWAHNYHVSRESGAMGSHLASTHGKDYLVVGQLFHQGFYNAAGSPGGMDLGAYYASPSMPGSVEYALHATGMPRLILDLRKASRDDPASSWFLGTAEYRFIGASRNDDGFMTTNHLAKDYDALVFFDHTTPSILLQF